MGEKRLERTISKLKKVKSILETGGVEFWLMSGTLLGCIQRGEILPNDRDVDLGSRRNQIGKFDKIVPKLEKEGLRVERRVDPFALRLKGMYTVKGSGMPIDIKFFDRKGKFMFRSIHRNDSEVASALWDMADIAHFGKVEMPRRPNVSRYISSAVRKVPDKIRKMLGYALCKLWIESKSRYGFVVFPKKYFEKMKIKKFYEMEFKVPQNPKKYIREEYGEKWKKHDPSGKGGWEKPSHIVIREEKVKPKIDYERLVKKAIKIKKRG